MVLTEKECIVCQVRHQFTLLWAIILLPQMTLLDLDSDCH